MSSAQTWGVFLAPHNGMTRGEETAWAIYDGANQRARTRVYDYCFMICQVPSFNAGFFQKVDATTDIPIKYSRGCFFSQKLKKSYI